MNSVIILGAGKGTRFNEIIPKQFLELNNNMIIEYSIKEFLNNKNIDEIIVVCHKEWINKLKRKYKNLLIIKGGKTRAESSIIGVKHCNKKCNNVLILDAARPNISQELINKTIKYIKNYDAVIPVLQAEDSLICSTELKYLKRKDIKQIQTPQAFKHKLISEIYNNIDITQNQYSDDFSALLS